MSMKQRKITEVLMQCRNFRCVWIGQVSECDIDDQVFPGVQKNLLIAKEYEGLLKCPKCGSIVNQINKG